MKKAAEKEEINTQQSCN